MSVTRCTEAGVYCPQFVKAVCDVLQQTLEVMVGGVQLAKMQPREVLRAGGTEDAEEEEHGIEDAEGNERGSEEAEGAEDARDVEGTEAAEDEGTEDADDVEGKENGADAPEESSQFSDGSSRGWTPAPA